MATKLKWQALSQTKPNGGSAMSSQKKLIADLLFGVQIIGAFVFSGSQFFRLLENTTGQSLSMQIIMEIFLCIQLMLAIGAHQTKASRITRQTVGVYTMWLVFVGSNIVAIFINGHYRWGSNDISTTWVVLGGLVVMVLWAMYRKLDLKDPMIKGLAAILFKAVPQLMMAVKIAQEGGAGVPMVTIIVGNVTALTRLGQIYLVIREAGRDRNRLWLGISEATNELGWATVTVVWAIWRFS